MNIDLIAKLKRSEDFFEVFQEGDQFKTYDGVPLIFYSLSNNDLDTRYKISSYLLDKGVDVKYVNKYNQSVFHVLLGQVQNDVPSVCRLCERMIAMGADINVLDKNNVLPLKYILNMKYTDEELKPLYDLWFSQPNVILDVKDKWGLTPIDFAKKVPYRKEIVERMEKYVQWKES